MDDRLLQIRDHTGEGFKPLVQFESWRVAILRSRDDSRAAGIRSLERHMETDEVFVLTAGRAALLLGGDGSQPDRICVEVMQIGTVYNIRQAVWHGVLLSPDASILIVENQDTSTANSQYLDLTSDQRALVLEAEKRSGV